MKKILELNCLFILLFTSIFWTNAAAQTYYVDALNGNNNNSGTSADKAWSTLQKAVSSVGAGATVIIAGGTYFGKVTIPSTANGVMGADVRLDPLFNNVAINDFSLLPTSPAINKGVPVTLPSSTTLLFTDDFNGNPKGNNWDMGAYEYTPRVGTKDLNDENSLKIYPNPANNYVVLEQIKGDAMLELYDVLGKKVLSQKTTGSTATVDVSGLSKGIYVFKLLINNGLQTGKFVKD